ncbi:MAG: GGDEF domain-containing protein [Coriobacteriales bacterium]|nr:GGDEF domain-containing protein [Coriobacteriales bacterium]
MRRYRIGLLGVHSAIDYPQSLRMGAKNTIEEAGHTLVTIAELIPYHTLQHAEAYLRVACTIASRLDLDAIVYPAGCATAYLRGDSEAALKLLQILDPAKTLVLERDVEGYRCITKDNAPGMHECMRHLIEGCGFTRIAFISGPATSRGAKEREDIYFQEMAAHGIEVEPSLFVRGDFGGDCADVVERLLDNNPNLEAIACACDLIAYTAYEVLHKRGLAVGEDIAVTGFDDHPRSAHLDPPLSTVRMTSYDYGCMAAREALRMCEGLPQEARVISSRFVARNSCGENAYGGVELIRGMLTRDPFPADEFVSIMMDATLTMAGPSITCHFREHMESFFGKVRDAYLRHRANPSSDDLLFSSQDLAALFEQDYSASLSLEGFHSGAITLLEALLEESPADDVTWVIQQISYLHLRVARLLNSASQADVLRRDKREWITFHTVDDALREDRNPTKAYELILREFGRMGIREADLFLLPEPIEFMESHGFALSDELKPVGRLARGAVEVAEHTGTVMLPNLLERIVSRYEGETECIIGGVVAGIELMGIAAINSGALSDHDQLMVYLNVGFAFKHLQMIATEREMNEILSQNNLLLARQSTHDEMTGLLNRRGFMHQASRMLSSHAGRTAAVLYLDLDGLKTINDTLGHDVGDDAICETASILVQCLPSDGALGRLGGDEFVALVFADGQDQVNAMLSKIQEAMDVRNATNTTPYELSISSGSCLFVVEEGVNELPASLMAQADERLYEMKRRRKASRRYADEG